MDDQPMRDEVAGYRTIPFSVQGVLLVKEEEVIENHELKELPLWVWCALFALPLPIYLWATSAIPLLEQEYLIVLAPCTVLLSLLLTSPLAVIFRAMMRGAWQDALIRKIAFRVRCIYERHTLNLP